MCVTSLLTISILGGCLSKAAKTKYDYERALNRYEELTQKFFSTSRLVSDEDAVEALEEINGKIEDLYKLEIKAEKLEIIMSL